MVKLYPPRVNRFLLVKLLLVKQFLLRKALRIRWPVSGKCKRKLKSNHGRNF